MNLLKGDQFLQTNYFHRSAKSIFNHFLTACDVLHWYCACNVQCNTETFRTAVSYLTVVDASERISNIFPSDKAGFSLFLCLMVCIRKIFTSLNNNMIYYFYCFFLHHNSFPFKDRRHKQLECKLNPPPILIF